MWDQTDVTVFNVIFHSDKRLEILWVFAMVFHWQEDSCCSLGELKLSQHFATCRLQRYSEYITKQWFAWWFYVYVYLYFTNALKCTFIIPIQKRLSTGYSRKCGTCVWFIYIFNSSGYIALNDRTISKEWIQKGLKFAASWFKVISWHFPGGTEENHRK